MEVALTIIQVDPRLGPRAIRVGDNVRVSISIHIDAVHEIEIQDRLFVGDVERKSTKMSAAGKSQELVKIDKVREIGLVQISPIPGSFNQQRRPLEDANRTGSRG